MEGEHNAVTWNHAFGVQSASGAVSYLDEANMLYPVGRHLAICAPMDLKNTAGAMSFVELEQEVTAIAVSHDRKHVAVVEEQVPLARGHPPRRRGPSCHHN